MNAGRRRFLKIAGSGAVIVAAGAAGATGFALTRTPEEALEPWTLAGSAYDDPARKALSYALLAPNPHNRQPWIVDLVGETGFTLYCDPERRLPETDPFDRQITIGLGCFLELMRMAAAADGYRAEIMLFPEGEPQPRLDRRPIARVTLHRDEAAAPSPLFAHVFARRSTKEPFDTGRPVSAEALTALKEAAGKQVISGATHEADQVAALRALTWEAHRIEVLTPRTNMESVRLMRIGKAEIEANPDGIDIGGPVQEALNLAGLLDRESLADPQSTGFQQGLALYEAIMKSAMAYVWITTDENTRSDQIASGAAWLHVNLKAAALGLCVHPVSQALQEYEEMTALYDRLHERLSPERGRVQMLGRVGYGPEVPPSPRWPLETRLRGS